ncbi:MAG: AAA family ATPase [Methylococcales bacterium]|nr:AAA family ATPase [Methylococcales bacterium]
MYKQHFHFSELPFSISPDPHFIYMSARHQEGLAHLLYGMDFGGGFVALTGEVGTGKTTLCHCLLQQLPENIDVALILNSKLNVLELVATICDELGIDYDKSQQSLKNLIDLLNQYLLTAHANGRRTVLLIDEAQNLSMDVLEQIRLLTNLETSKTKLLRIILVGQPELKDLLKRQDLRQLNQRITARYHLQPLSLQETRAYIRHRLIVSNGQPDIFKETAIRKIYKLSSGIPRLINILCDRALLGAYSTNATLVTPAIVKAAAREVLVATVDNKPSYLSLFFSLFFLGCLIAGIYFLNEKPKVNQQAIVNLPATKVVQPITPKPEDKKPLPIEKAVVTPLVKAQSFNEWISNPQFSLDAALINALKAWGKKMPENNKVDCHSVEATGLKCVFGKANWKDMLALNRPVILEFSLADKDKHHALLAGLGQNQSLIHFLDKVTFPVADVLKYWDGYYLLLESPSMPDANLIPIHQASDKVLWLRYVLNSFDGQSTLVEKPRFYDDELAEHVKHFQRQYQLTEDGKVGAKTMDQLKNLARQLEFSHLEITD